MGQGQLNRRGLLGLLAAAPFAAVVKPAKAAPQITMGRLYDRAAIRETVSRINEMFEIYKGEKIDIWTPNECQDHPPISRAADDEGPGASAKEACVTPPSANVSIPSGAPVPDISPSDARGGGLPERSPGSPAFQNRAASDSESENPILQHARAC